MTRIRNFAAVASAALLITAAAWAHPGHPPLHRENPTTVELPPHGTTIPLELFRGQRIFVKGGVNHQPLDIMLDSAAGATVMDKATAQRLGIKGTDPVQLRGVGGVEEVLVAHNVDLHLGGMEVPGLDVVIIDLQPLARGMGRDLPMIVGKDVFNLVTATFDFQNNHLTLGNRGSFVAPRGAVRLELANNADIRSAEIAIAGDQPTKAQVDLGNPYALSISKAYWSSQSKLQSLKSAQWQAGGVGGFKPAFRVTVPKVEFAGQTFVNVPAIVNDAPDALPVEGANVGVDILKRFLVTLDFGGNAMYLQAAAKAEPFFKDRAGLRADLVGDRFRVAFVSPDGPAAAAGLKSGDEITAINGHPVTSAFYSGPLARWSSGSAGEVVRLTKADGKNTHLTLRDYY